MEKEDKKQVGEPETKPVLADSADIVKANLIQALNNTLLANKAIGNYEKLEELCVNKLIKIIKSISVE